MYFICLEFFIFFLFKSETATRLFFIHTHIQSQPCLVLTHTRVCVCMFGVSCCFAFAPSFLSLHFTLLSLAESIQFSFVYRCFLIEFDSFLSYYARLFIFVNLCLFATIFISFFFWVRTNTHTDTCAVFVVAIAIFVWPLERRIHYLFFFFVVVCIYFYVIWLT